MKVTWIGHATALFEHAGGQILVDPLGRRRTRNTEAKTVLITHAHVDHLNRWTLAKLPRDIHLILPKGAKVIVEDFGFAKVTEIEPGDQIPADGAEITAVETRHDAGRWRKGDGPICAGYVVHADGAHIHHAGDIDFSDFAVFDDIGKRFSLDATLLPIGGLLPVWYYRLRNRALDRGIHIDPDTALALSERLGAKKMIPVHWGTVHLPFSPYSGPKTRLVQVAEATNKEHLVEILSHGQSFDLNH